ncbi:hydantoinase B/oxoprolinase family protein [Streptomyces sp. SID8352]|uniref:hydantoinase B/oxoprolinase family protein n=1 Tax=Streptomyces sp. SID8352 TaxID=2690338 RepID=UPI00136FF108|nr:hydantoinase B/oxoprolinase family protein [Streptomyces sp. SID8352]MYU20797.1 hypothetical protein [Streptomyces sp. SID8352]
MPAARHFLSRTTFSDDQLRTDIKADAAASRKAQRELQEAGKHHLADQMGAAADEALDELSDLNNGIWKPNHHS